MRSFENRYSIEKRLGVITMHPSGWANELNLISWNGGPVKYDIRDWSPDHTHMTRGITLLEEEMDKVMTLVQQHKAGFTVANTESHNVIFKSPDEMYAYLVDEEKELYNIETGTILIPDVNDEGKYYGLMTYRLPLLEAFKLLIEDGETNLAAWILNHKPAPGTMAIDRLGFIPFESIKERLDVIYASPSWGDTSLERLEYELGKNPVSSDGDINEFLGCIIDIFEDFLEEKNISIENPEKRINGDTEGQTIIYGSDYGLLKDQLYKLMSAYSIIKPFGM